MHQQLTEARYASLSGANVDTDFVEAPSQMLENFVFEPEVLSLVSSDRRIPGQPLPARLDEADGRRAPLSTPAVRYSRQVLLGAYDLHIHTHGAQVDADAVMHKLWLEIMGFPSQRAPTRPPASDT